MEFNIKSPANIAFVKYWGQKNHSQVIPWNDSFSMNLSHCYTELYVEVVEDPSVQEMSIKEYKSETYIQATKKEMEKVSQFYATAKNFLGVTTDTGFRIRSANSFPKKAGIASSAAFFSALALAFTHVFGKKLEKKQLSILARLSGSGSACRSIPDGFVWWHKGTCSENSYAESLADKNYWDLEDIVLVLSSQEKKVSSQDGHTGAVTSPYFEMRQQKLPEILGEMKDSFMKKDFTKFGTLVEQEAINFHSVMMTQNPPLFFWSERTLQAIKEVIQLREHGIEAYFTIDAGENVHVICRGRDTEKIDNHFKQCGFVEDIITNTAAEGAKIV